MDRRNQSDVYNISNMCEYLLQKRNTKHNLRICLLCTCPYQLNGHFDREYLQPSSLWHQQRWKCVLIGKANINWKLKHANLNYIKTFEPQINLNLQGSGAVLRCVMEVDVVGMEVIDWAFVDALADAFNNKTGKLAVFVVVSIRKNAALPLIRFRSRMDYTGCSTFSWHVAVPIWDVLTIIILATWVYCFHATTNLYKYCHQSCLHAHARYKRSCIGYWIICYLSTIKYGTAYNSL